MKSACIKFSYNFLIENKTEFSLFFIVSNKNEQL